MRCLRFEAIGTHWQIDLPENTADPTYKSLDLQIKKLIDDFDLTFSRFRNDSWITAISKKNGTFELSIESIELFELYYKFYKLTSGQFTPLIGQTLSDAGYDKSYSLKPKSKIDHPPSWEESLSLHGRTLTTKKPLLLDFGAAGKGFLVELVGSLLTKAGMNSFCIDAGGDILHRGIAPITVGLEDPNDQSMIIGTIDIQNQSVCASAGNRRKWDNYHHTLDPFSLTSPNDIIATWVVAKKAQIADALSTCLMLNPDLALYKGYEFECLLLYKNYSVKKTPGFDAQLF